ncbi:hypothetical protein DSO57_1007554 [Entomophthora muscae]|uniref:Uncharacterized protein n=1 Tax=Entomophthora muscae TaxID=34485 RepID=A0ACC2RMD2_9FUNG|nr:hypothetical protein DSO57_1007554 [Entomophthora muscae]
MDMEPSLTPKPMPASAAKLPLDHTNKLFGIVYITLTGVIDTIVPAASLWLWVGNLMSYFIKLASILWWSLSTQSATRQFPNTSKPADQGWFPDTHKAVIRHKFQALMKIGGTKMAKKPKKQVSYQIKNMYPIMLVLLQQDPYLQMTEVCCLLRLHCIFIACCTAQLWIHRLVVGILALINQPDCHSPCQSLAGLPQGRQAGPGRPCTQLALL